MTAHGTDTRAADSALIARLKAGDGEAFTALVREHQGPVYRLLLRMLGNAAEAEDLAQDVFVSVFKAVGNFRGDCRLSTWIFRIAANHARNRIKYLARRQRKAQRPYEDDRGAEAAVATMAVVPAPDEVAVARQVERLLQQALQGLDDNQRALVILRDLEQVSYEDIQVITGLPAGTVKSRLHRARLALHRRYLALLQEGST